MANKSSGSNKSSGGGAVPRPGVTVNWSNGQSTPVANKPSSSGGGGLSAQVKAAGVNLSKNEALKIAESTSKSVAEVMAKAVSKGVSLGSSLVNNYNAGNLGINGNQLFEAMPGLTVGIGKGVGPNQTAALQSLQYLNNLKLTPGTVAAGYSTNLQGNQYNPIVLPKQVMTGVLPAQAPAAAPAATTTTTTGPVGNWENSVNNSNQALIDSINEQIKANSTQAELYMGQINDLMASLAQANQRGGLQNITPYATTTSVAPAAGAQMTQAITARKKPTSTDLSINPFVGDTAGTGLNIAI